MITDRIRSVVEQKPERIAYKVNGDSISYRQLWDRAYSYAQLLKKQGTSPVIIYGHKQISMIISILACIIANRTYVPVENYTPLYRLRQIIDLTHSSLVLNEDEISLDDIDCLNLDGLKKYENNEIKQISNDVVYMMFTSGSTGIPKGVPISKTNLNNFIDWISSLKPLCDYHEINVLNQASFSFDLSVADMYYSLCNGHTLIVLDSDIKKDYEKIFDPMKEIDVAVVTPTFMKLFLIDKDFNKNNYPNLKCVYFCGEQLEARTVRKILDLFPDLKIINAYGPTEATSAVSAILITKEMADTMKLLPVGEIDTLATDIEIIDDEIVLKGNSVFGGYIGNNVGGYYKQDNINCYKTGDIGYIEDGKLYCRGRKDSQVKFKGYRIELNDIENNINQIDGVKQCAVVAKYDDNQIVKTIQAFVVVDDNQNADYIRRKLQKFLPTYMIPKTIKIIDRLPINHNGKIDRKAVNQL